MREDAAPCAFTGCHSSKLESSAIMYHLQVAFFFLYSHALHPTIALSSSPPDTCPFSAYLPKE